MQALARQGQLVARGGGQQLVHQGADVTAFVEILVLGPGDAVRGRGGEDGHRQQAGVARGVGAGMEGLALLEVQHALVGRQGDQQLAVLARGLVAQVQAHDGALGHGAVAVVGVGQQFGAGEGGALVEAAAGCGPVAQHRLLAAEALELVQLAPGHVVEAAREALGGPAVEVGQRGQGREVGPVEGLDQGAQRGQLRVALRAGRRGERGQQQGEGEEGRARHGSQTIRHGGLPFQRALDVRE